MSDGGKVLVIDGHTMTTMVIGSNTIMVIDDPHRQNEQALEICIEAEERQIAALSVLAEETNPASGTNKKSKRCRPRDRRRDRRHR